MEIDLFQFFHLFPDNRLHVSFFVAVHPSCMDLSEELARRAARSPWQCIDCKTCNVCDDSGYAVSLQFIKIFIFIFLDFYFIKYYHVLCGECCQAVS